MNQRQDRDIPITKPEPRPGSSLTVPAGMWKAGMYGIPVPEIASNDPGAPVPMIWCNTQAEAEAKKKKAIKNHMASLPYNTSVAPGACMIEKKAAQRSAQAGKRVDPVHNPVFRKGAPHGSWRVCGVPHRNTAWQRTRWAVDCKCVRCGHQQLIECLRLTKGEANKCRSCATKDRTERIRAERAAKREPPQ